MIEFTIEFCRYLLSTSPPTKARERFWLGLTVVFSLTYSLMALQKAFDSTYVVQDDARQHVFWMQRFLDPSLFPNDLIADYFQTVAPSGYTTVYRLAAGWGIDPLLFSKLLPVAIALVTTIYCFYCTLLLFPVAIAAFSSSLLLAQSFWMNFDVVSATPRAFLYPIFIAFVYYFLKRSWLGIGGAIALLGLFYPQYVFIASGLLLLQVIEVEKGSLKLCKNWQTYRFCGWGLAIAFAVMLPYALKTNVYGPVIDGSQAVNLPEFWAEGRAQFFNKNAFLFWTIGERSGILPPLLPPLIWLGVFLPFCLPRLRRSRDRFPLVGLIQPQIRGLFLRLGCSSLGMFVAAHLFLFKLHLPNRYIEHTWRFLLAIASGIFIAILWDAALKLKVEKHQLWGRMAAIGLAIALLGYPIYTPSFPRTNYRPGRLPELYSFFQQQPKNIAIASLSGEANNLPTFSHRSILVGREYAIPYHLGYYRQFSQRIRDLIEAQYSPELSVVKQFIDRYRVNFWLVERSAFSPEYLENQGWLHQYQPQTQQAIADLRSSEATVKVPVVAAAIDRCRVFESGDFVVLDARCIVGNPSLE